MRHCHAHFLMLNTNRQRVHRVKGEGRMNLLDRRGSIRRRHAKGDSVAAGSSDSATFYGRGLSREGRRMVLDYLTPGQGIGALNALTAAGIPAVLTPYKLLDRGGGVEATCLVVHRIEVPVAYELRAGAVLDEHGLLIRRSE